MKEPKSSAKEEKKKTYEGLWDYNKLQVGHNLSCVHYYHIQSVNPGFLHV